MYVCMYVRMYVCMYRLVRYADVPKELLADPSAAFRHIATDVERQVGR